jgi:hypothetical protein
MAALPFLIFQKVKTKLIPILMCHHQALMMKSIVLCYSFWPFTFYGKNPEGIKCD